MANALATDIFCEVKSSVVFRKKFSGWAGHIHFDRGIFVSGGVRQSKSMLGRGIQLKESYLDDIKEGRNHIV